MSVLIQQIREHLAKVLAGLQVRAFVLRLKYNFQLKYSGAKIALGCALRIEKYITYSEGRLDVVIPNRVGLNHFDRL